MTFKSVVSSIRKERGLVDEIPSFDPQNGNENAYFLFLLEAPGPKALASGRISLDNDDPTARNFRVQLDEARISRSDIAIWNTIPWYIGKDSTRMNIRASKKSDINEGIQYLPRVLECMRNLEFIVLVGSAARRAHVSLSCMTKARILSCHHTSAQSMNSNPTAWEENVSVFSYMRDTSSQSESNHALQRKT